MKILFSLVAAVVGIALSAWAQPTITIWPNYDSSIFLNASKLYGALPGNATTLQLLTAPLFSDATNLIQIVGGDCGSLGRSSTVLSNSTRFPVYLPSWNQGTLSITMLQSVCSNEPNHQIIFSLRAASIANNGDLTAPVWSGYYYTTNTLASSNLVSAVSFPPIIPGNGGTTNSVVLLELGRLADQFLSVVTVAQLGLSYAKNVSQ